MGSKKLGGVASPTYSAITLLTQYNKSTYMKLKAHGTTKPAPDTPLTTYLCDKAWDEQRPLFRYGIRQTLKYIFAEGARRDR